MSSFIRMTLFKPKMLVENQGKLLRLRTTSEQLAPAKICIPQSFTIDIVLFASRREN